MRPQAVGTSELILHDRATTLRDGWQGAKRCEWPFPSRAAQHSQLPAKWSPFGLHQICASALSLALRICDCYSTGLVSSIHYKFGSNALHDGSIQRFPIKSAQAASYHPTSLFVKYGAQSHRCGTDRQVQFQLVFVQRQLDLPAAAQRLDPVQIICADIAGDVDSVKT